jgi:ABC-2 type transport system ATP-binding protein
MIEARGLVKRYGGFEAVKGVTFSVDRGEIVGLLGPNGAGKTSLMRILTCYHAPTAGTASVAGHDVNEDPHAVRAAIGYLPESAPLYPDMTVKEYLSFVADARGMTGPARRERTAWAVETCGLPEMYGREIRRLSKGYRQRAGLAQAILHDPAVLILDEPTSGLDPNQVQEMRALIRGLGAQKTVLLSTHVMQEVEAMCRTVMIMNGGTVVARGTAEEIARGVAESVVLTVTFKAPLADDEVRSLAGLPGARGAQVRTAGPDRVEVDITVSPGADPSEKVYDWAVGHGAKILGMTTQKTSLEELFSRLTAGGRE